MTTTPGPDRAKVDRVLLWYREAVAQATEQAFRELRAAGVPDPAAVILQRPRPGMTTAAPDAPPNA